MRDGRIKPLKTILITMAVCLLVVAGNADAGTYTSTKHGTDADRSVVVPGFPYTTKGLCAQCHEQHAGIDGNEPTPPASEGPTSYALFRSNFGLDKNELCYACHETFTIGSMPLGYGRYGIYQGKTKYNNSIHYSSGNMLWSPDPVPPGPPLDDAGNCHNCHNPHGYDDGGGLIPNMLFARDSKTGDSPAYEMGCEACHDGTQGGAFKNVKAQLNKTYSHPTHRFNNRHVLPETGRSEGGSSFGPANRHAECVDCHNPHALGSTGSTHTPPGNAVSGALKNVWGVAPSWPSIWTQPKIFTVRRPPAYPDGSSKEYQICFKCHSYYGLGSLTNAVSSIIGPSGVNITDQAWEFNRNNKSAHSVVVTLNNQTGSYSPKALASSQMSPPWTNVGNQTMYCSDCHGADNEGSGAKGPHGSNVKFMLKGAYKYWPARNDGQLWRLSDKNNFTSYGGLFCKNCHPVYDGTWKNNVHSQTGGGGRGGSGGHQDQPCVACHVAVPHGSKRSRLIGYSSDPAPYNYNGNTLKVTGFRKAGGPFSYSGMPKNSTGNNCATAGVSGCHGSSISGADP